MRISETSTKKMLENNKLPAAFRKIFERIVAKNEAEAPKADEPKAEQFKQVILFTKARKGLFK